MAEVSNAGRFVLEKLNFLFDCVISELIMTSRCCWRYLVRVESHSRSQ